MDNTKSDFIIQAAILDKYIHLKSPSLDNPGIKTVVKKLKQSNDLRRYFLGQNPSPGWASVLYQNRFFDNPPNVIQTGQGYQTPFWLLSSYLLTVAGDVSEIVVKVASEIETNNPVIHEHLIKALCKIPAGDAINLIGKVKWWLRSEYSGFWGIAEGISSLISHFFQNGFLSQGLELLDEVLTPIPSPIRKYETFSLGGEAKTRQELDHLRPDFWHESLPGFERKAFPGVIQILENKLVDTLRIEMIAKENGINFSSWKSSIWRSTIGDGDQNLENSFKDSLLVALRNALTARSETMAEKIRPIVMKYLASEVVILRRLGLFICSKYPVKYRDLAIKELVNKTIHDDPLVHNEYFLLLNKSFPHFQDDIKSVITEIILAGPEREISEFQKEFVRTSNISVEEYVKKQRDFWVLNRLFMISDHLSKENQGFLTSLVATYGKPEHPEFLAWSSGGFSVREVSPLSANEFSQMSADEIFYFIKSWQYNPDQEFGPERISTRGLAETVADLVLNKPTEYRSLITKMDELHPLLSAVLFNQARELSKKNDPIPWAELLQLAIKCAENIYNLTHSDDNFEARLEAIRLILHGLTQKTGGETIIPIIYLNEVKNIINIYLEDSHPNTEQDRPQKGYFGYKDPITVSLNSVRPMAFMCFMEILRFQLSNISNDSQSRDLLTNDINIVLDKKLDKVIEPSLAVHSIFGRYFWLLANISLDWIRSNQSRIFPLGSGEENHYYFSATWDSYLIFNKPSTLTMKLLRNEYVAGINSLNKKEPETGLMDFEGHLFTHIFLDYLWTPYDVSDKDSLLNLFFTCCDQKTRGIGVNTMCRIVDTIPKDTEFNNKRWLVIKSVWQWRVNELSLTQFPEEFKSEIEAFSNLPKFAPKTNSIKDLWSLLRPFLSRVDEYRVWKNLEEFLANRIDDEPEQVAKYYFEMHINLVIPGHGYFPHYDETSDKIVDAALKDIRSRRTILDVIDLIYRRGNPRYRNLYERYV